MTELLWRLVADRPSPEALLRKLKSLSDAEVRTLAVQYLNVRYALMQAIEDAVDWLIRGGANALTATLAGEPPLPDGEHRRRHRAHLPPKG